MCREKENGKKREVGSQYHPDLLLTGNQCHCETVSTFIPSRLWKVGFFGSRSMFHVQSVPDGLWTGRDNTRIVNVCTGKRWLMVSGGLNES